MCRRQQQVAHETRCGSPQQHQRKRTQRQQQHEGRGQKRGRAALAEDCAPAVDSPGTQSSAPAAQEPKQTCWPEALHALWQQQQPGPALYQQLPMSPATPLLVPLPSQASKRSIVLTLVPATTVVQVAAQHTPSQLQQQQEQPVRHLPIPLPPWDQQPVPPPPAQSAPTCLLGSQPLPRRPRPDLVRRAMQLLDEPLVRRPHLLACLPACLLACVLRCLPASAACLPA